MTTRVSRGRCGALQKLDSHSCWSSGMRGEVLGWRTSAAPASLMLEGSNTTNQKSPVLQHLPSAFPPADAQDMEHPPGHVSSKELPKRNQYTPKKSGSPTTSKSRYKIMKS